MRGETAETNAHKHTWDAVRYDNEICGFTDSVSGHRHDVTIPVKEEYANAMDVTITTSLVDGHSHDVVIPADVFKGVFACGPEDEKKEEKFQDPVYGPDDSGDEEDEKKRAKRKIDDDGLPIREEFQSMTDKKWDGSKSRFTIEQLRKAVPAAMRKWGDSQPKGPDGEPSKANYKLPFKEPNGTINVNGVRNALARAGQVKGPSEAQKSSAVKELQGVLEKAKSKGFEGDTPTVDFSALTDRHGPTVMIHGERLFAVGEWNGHPITLEYLEKIAENYNTLRISFEPAIKAGHDPSDHSFLMGELAAGWAVNLRVENGQYLVGDLEVPTKVYEEYLQTKSLRYKSVEIVPNFRRDGKEYGPVMVGLALLGANYPAANGLGAVALPFSEEKCDVVRINYDSGGEEIMTEEEKKAADEKKAFEDRIAKLEADNAKLAAEKAAEAQEKATFAAKITEQETALAASQEAAKHLGAKLRSQEAQAFADSLKADGKLTPEQEEGFVRTYLTLNDEIKVSYKDAEGKDVTESQVDMFKALFSSRGKQVDLDNEVAAKGTDAPIVPEPNQTPALPIGMAHSDKFAEIIKKQGLMVTGADVTNRAKQLVDENKLDERVALSVAYAEKHNKPA
jgi:hypothetical protein